MSRRLLVMFLVTFGGALLIAVLIPSPTALVIAQSFQHTAAMHSVMTLMGAFVLYATTFALVIPVTTVLAIALGFLFGFPVAFTLVATATLVGASAPYVYARRSSYACRTLLGSSYLPVVTWARTHPFSYLLATRFSPLVPFPLVHLVPAEARIGFRKYLVVTILGSFPASAAFVAFGSGARSLTLGAIGTPLLLGGLMLLSLSVLVGVLVIRTPAFKSALREIRRMHPNPPSAPHETRDA